MVDLPSIPNAVPQLRAPESRVSPAQIAAPYQELAANLTKMGEVADKDLAQPLAEQAGQQAVSEDGKSVAQPTIPIVGPAAAEFARAARFTALARMTPEIENGIAELKVQHANDPQGFQQAAKAYKDTYINGDADKGIPAVTDPALKGPVESRILQTAGGAYRSVLQQTDATNAANAKTAITAQITDLSNRMAQSAFAGGVDTDDYKRMQGDLGALYRELGSDPRMGYPQARIDSELSNMISQQRTMALAGQAIRMMDGESPTARADAKKWLIDKVYNDPTLNLSLAERHQAVTTAMGLMEARSAENKALIDANKSTVTTLLAGLHSTQPYNPITINEAKANSAKIGDAESFYKITFAQSMHDWSESVRSLPMPQQVAALRALDASRINTGSAATAMDFFTSRGYSREQAAGIVGNLIQESGLNPNTIHDNGTGLGIAGHRLERLDALKAYAASKGKPASDFQTQLEFIDQELRTTEKGTGDVLRTARTPQEAARAFISYERPQGWTAANPEAGHGYANRVANAEGLAGGNSGAGRAWFEEARLAQVNRTRDYLKGQAGTYADTVVKMLNQSGDVPDEVLRNAADVLRETGQDDQRAKIDKALMAHYGVKELDSLPAATRAAWAAQAAPAARDSVLAYQVHEQMADTLKATADAMQKTPYSTYASRTNAQPPPIYNFDDPSSVAAVATARAGQQRAIRANDRTGPISVFEGKEAEAFANTLTNGDPGVAAQALGRLANLPDDVYQATLAQKPVANAVAGMMSSKDPARMTAAMGAADKLWRANPAQATDALGSAAVTKLQAWQGLQGSFNSAELAERLNAADEPSTLKAREAAKDAAEKETEKLTPADMAYKLGTSWGIPILSSVANVVTGATPAVPFDSIKGGELVADYRATYSALRAYGVDADKASDLAIQRLTKAQWGVSAAAGNQVMKNPPERSYPAIGGSHDWLQADLNEWITRRVGPEFGSGMRSIEAGVGLAGRERNWSLAGLVSDGQTQAEVAAGRPPSYQVAIKKTDGTLDIMPSRIAFDPSDHIAEYGARLEQRRQAVDFMRPENNAGMPQP